MGEAWILLDEGIQCHQGRGPPSSTLLVTISQFYRNGYLVVPAFLAREEAQALLERAKQLLDEFDLEEHPLSKLTAENYKQIKDEYFLTSGDKIRFFLEDEAVDSDGKLNRPKERAVNKIGHGVHELDPIYRKVTLENERWRQLIRDLKFHHDPIALQSIIIAKQSEIGSEAVEHNDSTFLYSDPPSTLGFWIALEKSTAENGALSFLPGSHLTTPIKKRFVRLPSGGMGYEQLISEEPEVERQNKEARKGKYVLETCEPGDLVLIHGSVLHRSEKNTSQRTRFAYAVHMIDSTPHVTYDSKNWLQPTEAMPFSRIL